MGKRDREHIFKLDKNWETNHFYSSVNVFSTAVLIEGTVNMRKQILQIKQKLVKNPNWQEADQLAIYKPGGVKFGTLKHKSILWQGGGFEPGTSGLQVQRPNHQATLTLLKLRLSERGVFPYLMLGGSFM